MAFHRPKILNGKEAICCRCRKMFVTTSQRSITCASCFTQNTRNSSGDINGIARSFKSRASMK